MAIESLSDYKKRIKNKQVQKSTTGIESLSDYAKRNNIKLEYKGIRNNSGLFKQSSAFDDGWQFGDLTKTIGTSVGDLASDIGRGFLTTTEGIADTLQYGTAGVLDFFGADGAAKAVRENAKFNSTGAIFGENEDESDNLFKKGWAESLEDNSVIGDLGDSVAQGIGNVAAMAGTSYIGGALIGGAVKGAEGIGLVSKAANTIKRAEKINKIASGLTAFASAYGNARSNAYANGLNDTNSHTAGLINGFAEAISEQFFDKLPGMKTAGWGEGLTKKIGGGVARFFGTTAGKVTKEVLSLTGEGAEEIISNVLTTTGNNIAHLFNNDYTYGMENSRILKDGYQFGDITKDNFDAAFSKESMDAFISATLTSAIINGGNNFLTTAQKNTILKGFAKENDISVKEAKAQLKNEVQTEMKKNANLPFSEKIELEEKIQQEKLNNMKNNTLVEQTEETTNEQENNIDEKPLETIENKKPSIKDNKELYEKVRNEKQIVHVGNVLGILKSGAFSGSIATQNIGTRPAQYKGYKEGIVFKPEALDYINESKMYKGDGGNALLNDGTRTKENPNKYSTIEEYINEDTSKRQISKYNEGIIEKDNQLPINNETVDYILVSKDTSPELINEIKNMGYEVRYTTAKTQNTAEVMDNSLNVPQNQTQENITNVETKENLPVVEENLPVAEETKTEETPVVETKEETETEKVETKEETKEVDLGEKSVLKNTTNRNSIKAKEKAVKVAKSWLNLKDSNKQEFKDALDKYTRMSQEELLTGNTYEEIKNIVDRYSENEIVYTDEDVKEVKSRIRNAKIKVTEDLKSQITDYGYFRKSNLGKLRLGKEGTYIDVLWNELCEMYPHYFDSEVLAEADMLYALSDFMNEDNSITQKFTLDDADITEVTNDVFDTILDNALNKKQIESLTEKDNQLKQMNKVDVENIKTAESVIGTQEDYISARAEELFTELKGLKKGVRASNELSQILNLGYRWSDIKAALSNIKWKPGMEVNSKNSNLGDIESTIKQMINEEYQEKVQDLIFDNAGVEGDLTKEEVARLKRFNYAREVETLKDALESTSKELDKSIIEKQAEYDSKANKDTATAQKLLQQISTLKVRKANIELDYNKRIGNLTEKVKNFDVKEETRRMNRAEYKKNLADEIKGYIENASKWIDKKLFGGFRYSRETAQRNMVDVAGDVDGNAINDYVFNPVQEHEASKNRRIKEKFQKIRELGLDLKQQYEIDGEKVGEDDLVRRYIENSINKIELDQMGADSNKIIKAADTISEMLEGLFTDLNAELKKMGLPEVEHRKDYFPHGAEDKQDTFISKLAKVVGIDITNQELPTEIAGRTDEFKPNKAWNGHFLRRTGNKTNTDAIGNLEKYIAGVEDIIAHTEDIQKVRALSQEIRNQFTDEETQAKIDAINKNDSLSDEEKDDLIKDIYKRENSQLSGLVTWLDDYANVLSNKKSFADRDIERKIGRNAYTSMENIESMVAANTIGGNFSVSLTNFAPITQALATTKGRHLVKAALDVMKNDVNTLTGNENTSIKDMSDFLTNRFGTEGIGRQTWKDKIKNIAFKPMEIVDNFTSEVVVRAKYYENLEKGMDTYEAIKKADKDAAKIMADRSKGALPTIFNEKNPISKLITMFQVEPNNIISNYTKDMSRDAETKGQLAYQYTKLAIGSYVFNSILMGIRGGNEVLPDPIRFVEYLIKAITGDDDEREKAGEDMLEAVTSAIPFVSNVAGLLGMEDVGRIPISSALPDLTELVNLADDEVSGEYKAQTVRDEILKPLSYFLLPTGAAQVWKTVQGLEAVASGGSYKYAKDGELKMQFPVEDANVIDYAKAGLFGKYSLDEAKTYIDNGFKSLTEKQTQAYEKLNLPYEEYLEYNKGINKAKKDAKANDESQTEAVYDYIYNLPISTEQKNIMLNSALNNKDTITDDNGYIKYVNSKNRTYWYDAENNKLYNNNYHEVDSSLINELTQYSNEKDISGYENYDSLEEFNYANNNPEKHLAIMQITDYTTYNEYKDYIEDISNHYSDLMDEATNSKQKTAISNQKKAAIRQYINSLQLNKYQKLMLEKLAAGYSIKNYKSQLQKYINSLELTKEEKQTIDSALFD